MARPPPPPPVPTPMISGTVFSQYDDAVVNSFSVVRLDADCTDLVTWRPAELRSSGHGHAARGAGDGDGGAAGRPLGELELA